MPKKEISNNKVKEIKTKVPKKSNTKTTTKKVSVTATTKKNSTTAKKVTSPKKENKVKKEVNKIDKKVATKKPLTKEEKVKERTEKLAKAINNAEKKAKATAKKKETVKTNSKTEVKTNAKSKIEETKTNKKLADEATKKTSKEANEKASSKKVDKKIEEKLDKEDLKVVVKKETPKVDEATVIEKIKSFIAKIAEMQEEALKEENSQKDKKEKVKKVSEKAKEPKKASYMLEYYDLPYRYNETVVKILAQTPKVLFVYWDIADSDRNKYIETFGADFFDKTYPVLLLYNEDKKYVKEVPINDFANSWYIDIEDSKTKYIIQLGRKFKENNYNYINTEKLQNSNIILQTDYLPFADSNMLEAPNDHVLLETLPDFLIFRNVKTNQEFTKDIRDLRDAYGNSYNVKDFYNDQYKEEITDGMFDMANPSSNLSSSSFK